jgi:hypothetical protein
MNEIMIFDTVFAEKDEFFIFRELSLPLIIHLTKRPKEPEPRGPEEGT